MNSPEPGGTGVWRNITGSRLCRSDDGGTAMSERTLSKKPADSHESPVERTRSTRAYRPNVDIIEKNEELVLLADVPGARLEDIDVRYEKGTLELYARVEPRIPKEARVLLQEYGVGDYYRSFQVGESIDSSQISASYADGVLTLRLPKVEAAKPRKIAIQTR